MQQSASKTADERFWSCFEERSEHLASSAAESDLARDWWNWSLSQRADELLDRVSKSGLPDRFDEQKVSGIAISALMVCECAPQHFRAALEKQIATMRRLVREKGADYNAGGVSILEYWPQGVANIFHEIRKRALRLVSVARSEQQPRFDEAIDICLDIAAYSLFLLAYLDARISLT
jgi:hypothetical protein